MRSGSLLTLLPARLPSALLSSARLSSAHLSSTLLLSALLFSATVPAFASPHVRRGPTAPRLSHAHNTRVSSHAGTPRTGIAPERATQIQTALIKAGYLTGTPSGTWDAQSQAAMEKLQADNGWQTRIVPDSRAIIKLGLGSSTVAASVTVAPSTAATATHTEAAPPTTLFAGDPSSRPGSNQ
jgi:hypothetical protein